MSKRSKIVVAACVGVVLVFVVVLVVARSASHRTAGRTLTLYGNVDIRQVELGFRVAGRLAKLNFEEGQAVNAGMELAELDARPYEDEVRSAEAQVAAQEATLTKMINGPRPAELDQARAAVVDATAAAKNARLSFQRAEQLLPQDAITPQAHDDAQANFDRATARLAQARESLRLLEEGSRKEDIAAARAARDGARARLASARTALDDTRLVAPADGIVLSRVREGGAIVSPADVVYVLSLTRPVWVRAYVPEPHLGRVRSGLEVAVTSDTAPRQKLSGRIGFVSPTAEFTPKSVETPELRTDLVYRLRILVDDPDGSLLQGMPVTVHVPLPASDASAR